MIKTSNGLDPVRIKNQRAESLTFEGESFIQNFKVKKRQYGKQKKEAQPTLD